MKEIKLFSSSYWKYLVDDFKILLKTHILQVFLSLIFTLGLPILMIFDYLMGIFQIVAYIFLSLFYFIGTNLLVINRIKKFRLRKEKESIINLILFGPFFISQKNKYSDMLIATFILLIIKLFVESFKYILSPLTLLFALLSYHNLLNKEIVINEQKNYE